MTGLRTFASGLYSVLLLFCVADNVRAETVPDLYVAEVPVAGQDEDSRRQAIHKAFADVLVKVSGDRQLSLRGGAKNLLRSANRYVQEYGYRLLESTGDKMVGQSGESSEPDRLLRVRFDEQAVNRQLREHGIPVWGKTRPSILLWLGIEERGHRSLYQTEQDPGLRTVVERTATERGLPVLFPLMDLEDGIKLQTSDLWGGFEERIRRASDRYLPDVILVGRLRSRGSSDWIGDWSLYQPGEVSNWQSRASTKSGLAVDGLQEASDRLAALFAPRYVDQGITNLRIRVSGLDNLGDYILVQEYLESLDMIAQLNLLSAHPESVSFIAQVQGGRDALEKGIMLGGVLEPVVATDEVVSADATSPEALDAESLDFRLR